METKNETTPTRSDVTIATLLDEFDNGLVSLLQQTSQSFTGKVIMGYNYKNYEAEKHRIHWVVNVLNRLISDYTFIFPDKSASRETIDEILSLNCPTAAELESELKIRWLQVNNVRIENFPNFKLSKLAEAYDFPEDLERKVKSLSEGVETLQKEKKKSLAGVFKYLKPETGMLEVTEEQEREILNQHTIYASTEKLSEVLCLHMTCIGLSNLKAPDYSFKELPEIDHRLLKMIRIEKDKLGVRELGIVVDIDRINNPRMAGDPHYTPEVTQDPKSRPRVKVIVGGKKWAI